MSSPTTPTRLGDGWRRTRFDEFLKRVERKITLDDSATYSCVGVRWYGKGAFVRERLLGLNIARKQQWIIAGGDVVYNKLFAWKGAFAVADNSVDGCIVSDKFPTYLMNLEVVDPRFLLYYFQTAQLARQAEEFSKGAAAISKLTLNPPQFWDLTIPLPSLEEQRRVVARVEVARVKIEEARDLRRLALDEAEAVLGAASERIVGDLAGAYETKRLIDLVEPERGISYGVVLTGTSNEAGIPTLRAGDLQKFRVLLDKVKRIDPDIEARYKRTRLRGNEVLLRIRGGIGELAVCPPQMVGGNVSREIAVLPFKDEVLPPYGMYMLAAPCNQAKMTSSLRGTSYVGINLKDVRNMSIPVPPHFEQHKIIAYLDDMRASTDLLKRLQSETAAELDALLPSILDKAFKGEL